ncbi:MAG: hypothetical protein LKF74_02160 [Megasphaera sp.]|jgi:REP element-mobilizing transposase RayT|nr:hypothetical protein [Megasphaera sp.]MCH4187430.1 hypothetical protein [Megasphaera sp.]MCH4217349.1 hypothetical protein [Megasphaera sp.]
MYIKSGNASHADKTTHTLMPHTQLITFRTYQNQLTLGSIHSKNGRNIWVPSDWGLAVDAAMPQLKSFSNVIFIDSYSIMPNHIHMLVIFRSYQPRLTNWFISYSKQVLVQRMMRVRPAAEPIWDLAYTAQSIRHSFTQSAVSMSLKEHQAHWQYDDLYVSNGTD